jgi:hypothetical protein
LVHFGLIGSVPFGLVLVRLAWFCLFGLVSQRSQFVCEIPYFGVSFGCLVSQDIDHSLLV